MSKRKITATALKDSGSVLKDERDDRMQRVGELLYNNSDMLAKLLNRYGSLLK